MARPTKLREYTVTVTQTREFVVSLEAKGDDNAEAQANKIREAFEEVADKALNDYPPFDDMTEDWSVDTQET